MAGKQKEINKEEDAVILKQVDMIELVMNCDYSCALSKIIGGNPVSSIFELKEYTNKFGLMKIPVGEKIKVEKPVANFFRRNSFAKLIENLND